MWEESGVSQVLVVDNDEAACENIQMLMKDTGVTVDVVSDMEKATRMLCDNGMVGEAYQVLLIDWNVVKTEGLKSVTALQEMISETAAILFLTDSDTTGMEEALLIKNTKVLTKPFFVSAFRESILEIRAEQKVERKLETAVPDSLKGLYFLAAEDNEINSEILREVLSIEGADCEIVENGQQAVERFARAAENEFDAILMDVQMPVMNGYEATRAIRALKRKDAGEIPIIAMTANAFAEDEKEALDAGMNVHLTKPIDVELLKKVIHQYVHRKE